MALYLSNILAYLFIISSLSVTLDSDFLDELTEAMNNWMTDADNAQLLDMYAEDSRFCMDGVCFEGKDEIASFFEENHGVLPPSSGEFEVFNSIFGDNFVFSEYVLVLSPYNVDECKSNAPGCMLIYLNDDRKIIEFHNFDEDNTEVGAMISAWNSALECLETSNSNNYNQIQCCP
jgi:hypothetical protein